MIGIERDAVCDLVRGAGIDLSSTLTSECPESRELSIALERVQEAVFWAIAAIELSGRNYD